MTKQKKILSKGYTLTVTSWENDGDNYQTNSLTFDQREEAVMFLEACRLCRSTNNNPKGVYGLGNMCDEYELTENHINMIKGFFKKYNQTIEDEEYILDEFNGYIEELMDCSEFYLFRVFESATLYYSAEDMYVDLIDIVEDL